MQPYQEAAETTRRAGEGPISALKYAGAAALGAGSSMAARSLISRMIPLLNSHIPQSFAKKALNKLDPRFGKFIEKAEDEGFNFDEIKDFFTEKIEKSEPKKENNNILQQESPELFQ